jgi:S-DNA-T family DNA segregation ATPase FtsK/SpoIIIE
VGYNRAARMVEHMEREGLVAPADGCKPREVIATESPY